MYSPYVTKAFYYDNKSIIDFIYSGRFLFNLISSASKLLKSLWVYLKMILFEAFVIKQEFLLLFLCKNKSTAPTQYAIIIEGVSIIEIEKGSEKKMGEARRLFFLTCQEKKRCIEERKNKEEVYSVLVFARVFLPYSLFTFFSQLQVRRRRRYCCCCSYYNNNINNNSNKNPKNKCF
jgi:hypothetical protein